MESKPATATRENEPNQGDFASGMKTSNGAVSEATPGGSSNWLLFRFIESSHFTLFLCVSYLERYAGNIGIHSYLCQKLRSFPSEEIQFFLPQLVQLHVTVETESMALEDLLLDLCYQSTHYTLLVFWQLQAHLTGLSNEPDTYGFLVCKRLYNKLQQVLFNIGEMPNEKMRENIAPALVMASVIAAAPGVPSGSSFCRQMVVSQGRKQRSHVFHLASKLLRSRSTADRSVSSSTAANRGALSVPNLTSRTLSAVEDHDKTSLQIGSQREHSQSDRTATSLNQKNLIYLKKRRDAASLPDLSLDSNNNDSNNINKNNDNININSSSVNGLHDQQFGSVTASAERLKQHRSSPSAQSTSSRIGSIETVLSPSSTSFAPSISLDPYSQTQRASSASSVSSASAIGTRTGVRHQSRESLIQGLKTNYFRCETQFVYALQSISTRLLQVPKQARQSALKAELVLLNRDLPAEVDLPLLLPTITKGPNIRQNRIVRIAPGEATVLNSAEKVPFLLLIEYLRNDVDFDPDRKENSEILSKDRRYIFDMAYLHNLYQRSGISDGSEVELTDETYSNNTGDKQYDGQVPVEVDMGDMTLYDTKLDIFAHDALKASVSSLPKLGDNFREDTSSPRASDLSFSSSYAINTSISNPVDVTDLATQMRTAAIMLTQLDGSGGAKLPRDEVANIKAKIIANMQSMEDHSIFSNASIFKGEAGERKLENDLKTAGISSDDPSAANLGEDWQARKQRIRKSSPYGHLPNWDLFSVIAKTGFDLRQEAFACQLIHAFTKIWESDNVDVWTKDMKILITNESTGLVETITNGLSIHSIKKAMTTASMVNDQNPKGTIATLTDHFLKNFGDRNTPSFKNAINNFTKSLAAYSLICYLLQVKDRHNGNILLDSDGHIIHIDFGFLLSNTPGRFGFEAAPFKLTQEYVDIMGGTDSEYFQKFRSVLKSAFKSVRKQAESIIILVEMMSKDSNLPCFSSGAATSLQLRQRFQLHLTDMEMDDFVDNSLIQKSIGSIYTRLYDQFQLLTQGIYS